MNPTTETGSRGDYEWLSTDACGLNELLQKCPQAFTGKFIAVTSLDSGSLCLSEEQLRRGWHSRSGIAYSPRVGSADQLPHGGFDEWYVSGSPLDLGELWSGNVSEAPQTPGHICSLINFYGFALHRPNVQALAGIFWRQLDWIQPESYVADGSEFLTFVSRDKALFSAVRRALIG
jgi:hypothetical protein